MKPIQRVYLSTQQVHCPDIDLVLELNGCGRGFITAQTDQDYTGKLVRVDVGYTDLLLRWFTGYVERSQPAENGFQRLFVRELAGVFDKLWPCSMQHPTLKQIGGWLSEQSGIAVQIPDAAYAMTPIPHFTHSGTGFQLMNALGKAFSVPDYIWHPLPDGGLYLGGADGAMFAGRDVEIPAEFAKSTAGGNSMTLPVVQSLRPGVEMNGQRVTRVHLQNADMTATWTPRNRKTGEPLQKTPLQRQIEAHYPELASGLHTPKMGRVVAHTEPVSSGNFADPFRPRYAVDVQLLDADGGNDGKTPVYSAVPLPVPMAGHDSGLFQFPALGTLVEVGFTGGRPDKPFIRGSHPDGTSLPDLKPGEQLQQQRAEVSQRVTQAGDWERKTDQVIRDSSMAREVTADTERRELVTRETIVKATDKTTVIGTSQLSAGAVQHVVTGDYAVATGANRVAVISGDDAVDITGTQTTTTGKDLVEKVGAIRRSVAAVQQQLIAPVVWLGSEQINVTQLMLDTLDVINELATLTAGHTHPSIGTPTNAAAIEGVATKADALNAKYSPVIAK
ncbi:hypothetical protein [Klebsiella variicola]|uniref:hypothetical protein n=1 Tax=Klebsiella pneumoniae complex TaxID=3390273 RepID=UPI000578C692|nr:hypothetical protein [Klebsiella variicola]AJA96394.1 hypothetical protein KR75_16525 [Klebsiella variicola]HCB2374872.1 hypothetical protein [Klebsiella pneumoniae]